MFEIALLIFMIGVLALFIVPRLRRGKGIGGEVAQGTLLVTGTSPRTDEPGEQFVTISGLITGPTVNELHVYQRMVVDGTSWPSIGDLMPVVYSVKNPDNWRFAPDQQQFPPPPPPPPRPNEPPPLH